MDDTNTTALETPTTPRIGFNGHRLAFLGAIVIAIGCLHVILFSALDSVAPLGVDVSETSTLIVNIQEVPNDLPLSDLNLLRLIADAR
jgi:hypothetical protein